jgi:hypothetical protein
MHLLFNRDAFAMCQRCTRYAFALLLHFFCLAVCAGMTVRLRSVLYAFALLLRALFALGSRFLRSAFQCVLLCDCAQTRCDIAAIALWMRCDRAVVAL